VAVANGDECGRPSLSSSLPQPVAVLPWSVKPCHCSPTGGSEEAPAHPGDLSGARPKPMTGVAQCPISYIFKRGLCICGGALYLEKWPCSGVSTAPHVYSPLSQAACTPS
jgi:hypothetical protein